MYFSFPLSPSLSPPLLPLPSSLLPLPSSLSFIADLYKGTDDFMGRCFYLLSTIPSSGEVKTLELYSHSARSKRGTIKLDLRIEGMREGLSMDDALKEHKMLARALVDYESKTVRREGEEEKGEKKEKKRGRKRVRERERIK